MASNSSPQRRGKRRRGSSTSAEDSQREKKCRKTRSTESLVDSTTCSDSLSSLCVPATSGNENRLGIIEKISLRNFMCHSHLEFIFESRVNFINGRNGSGKSAILTALMVGLGGKASVTNRGSKVSTLIQEGRPSARIEITLSNQGPDAFKPELYGDSIIVVRTLHGSGGPYEIRGVNKKVVSTKRSELQAILQHLNIQVDNPVVVLNQETSRSFLQSKSSKDKYVFFLKATQLEQVKANYEEAEENASKALETYKTKAQLLPDIEEQMRKQEAYFKLIESVRNSRQKLKSLHADLQWSHVAEKELQVKDLQEALDSAATKLDRLKASGLSHAREADRMKDAMDSRQKEIDRIMKDGSGLSDELREKETRLVEDKRKYRDLEDKKKRIERAIRDLEADRLTLQNEIKRALANTNEEWHKEKERRTKEIATVEEQLNAVRAEESEATTAENAARQICKTVDARMREAAGDLRKAQDDSRRLVQKIETAKAAKADSVNRFGASTSAILADIKASSDKFRVLPKGPLGLHINVKDDRWKYAVERHCGSTLTAYMVDNNADYKILKNILNKYGVRNVTIFTRKFTDRPYKCPVTHTTETSISFLDVVNFTDADILNLFVDTNQINQILFFESLDDALSALKNPRTVPKHCAQALDVDYNRVHPAPRYRYFSNDQKAQVRLLNASANPLPELEKDLASCRNLENEAKKELKANQVKLAAAEIEVRKVKESSLRLRNKVAQLSARIRDLRDFEEPVTINVAPLENELANLDSSIKALESGELGNATRELESFIEIVRGTNRSFKEAQEAFQAHQQKLEELKTAQHKDRRRQEEARVSGENAKSMEAAAQRSVHEHEKRLNEKNQELEAAIGEAEKLGPRSRNIRSLKQTAIRLEIKAMEENIALKERTQPDPESTKEAYTKLKEQFDTLSKELQEVKIYLDELQQLVKQRKETLIKVRDLACFRVSTVFESLMENEKFRATLEFDHNDRKLEIKVHEMAQERTSHNDVRGLSGGERSYSTVCFICALWTNTEHTPFRVLDEFDIFMDMSKRRRSLQMLLEICEKQTGCQFIFLTPIEMPNIDALNSSSVKCQLMPEPKRTSMGV